MSLFISLVFYVEFNTLSQTLRPIAGCRTTLHVWYCCILDKIDIVVQKFNLIGASRHSGEEVRVYNEQRLCKVWNIQLLSLVFTPLDYGLCQQTDRVSDIQPLTASGLPYYA